MEKSEQERPRSAASATQREVSAGSPSVSERWSETLVGRVSRRLVLVAGGSHCLLMGFVPPPWQGLLLEEELAHLEQASAVATEVTSSIMRLKLEVEEKKRAISLLQTALVGELAPPAWGSRDQGPSTDVSWSFEAQDWGPTIRASRLCPQPGVAVAGWRLPVCHSLSHY